MSKKARCLLIIMIMTFGLYGCKKEIDVASDVPTFTEIVKTTEPVTEVQTDPTETPETTVETTCATVPEETVEETEPEETKTNTEVIQAVDSLSETNHSHSWKHSVTAPTCTTEGYTTHLCNCGAKEVDSKIAATGHTWDAWKTVTEATETSVGQAKRVCSACKASESRVLDKLPSSHKHSYTSTVTKASSCSSTGVKTFKCTCGNSYTEDIPKLAHQYSSRKIAATCTERGYTVYFCSICGSSYRDSYVNELDHTYSETVTQPTCTTDGYTTHKCACGDSYVDTKFSATGHTWSSWKVSKEATESSSGTKERTCSNCSAKENETIPKLTHSHKYTDTVTKPTCTTDGYTTHKCACGDSYTDTKVTATGHTWGSWTVTMEASESSTGIKEHTCSMCSAKETETIPKLPHTHKYTDTVTNPTCTTDGYTTHKCACGDSYTDTRVAATGHNWSAWKTTKEATESSVGTKERTCSTCKAKETDTIPKLEHIHKYTATVTKSTCTAEGYTTHNCSCGDSYVDNRTSAAGHSWNDWQVTKEATTSSTGTKERSCVSCMTVETAAIPTLTHTHSYSSVVTKPTCTEEGYTTYTCICGESYVDNNTSATGHNWEGWITTHPPTASDEGCAVRACITCGETESKALDKLPAHEHSWSLVQGEYRIRHFAVCPHCNVYLCELDGASDPNDALWAHIEESGGDWYNHSWANDVEYILLKPAHWKCAECGDEKPFEY